MDNKRPLVWLSADFPSRLMSPEALPGWRLLPVRVLDHPLPPAPGEGPWPVGVCLLAGLGNESLERVAAWMETLPVSAWLALITPEQRTRSRICRLIGDYCQDFHTLPPDLHRLELSLGHLWGMQALTAPYATTHATGPHTQPAGHATHVSGQDTVATDGPDPLAGRSPAITRARALMRRLAATDERVLIYGEPGTGRGAVARFLHRHSPRRHGPLVVINCAALPESLTQSELFGHERGAFTHALNAREGRILAANGGTLVLAGLDELSLAQQSALLRFLEDGHIEPVGARQPVAVDVRVLATCSGPLDERLARGDFRSDVFYRLGSLSITVPPLRDRLEDLPLLTRQALDAAGGQGLRLSAGARLALARHTWPGNLRELHNRVRRAVLLCQRTCLSPEDLGLPPLPEDPRFTLADVRARADQQAILFSLSLANQNVSEAARLLQISRVSLYRLMHRYQMHPLGHTSTHNPDRR
ncbi:sigma 54-interacting transcriptional regulator [Marinobacter sp. C2H3]|uniref:sigma 54-interacting transcriptional regulator n=1 Tax=Marinobacter sp. C2H3 TaxID=3119003 RepID=UPI00300EC580